MTNAEKLASAIDWLADRYVLHPSRRIPKGDYEPRVIRTNIAETFERVRSRLGGGNVLVRA